MVAGASLAFPSLKIIESADNPQNPISNYDVEVHFSNQQKAKKTLKNDIFVDEGILHNSGTRNFIEKLSFKLILTNF